MKHYRLLYPSEYLNAADLQGQDATVTIESVKLEDVPNPDGKKQRKPVLTFAGKSKRFPLPKTCAKVIAALHGVDTEQWVGKKVTLYPSTCKAFGQDGVECVRVRLQ